MYVHAICSAKSNAVTDPLFKSMRILKLQDIITLEQCKLGYQLKQNSLPKLIQNLFENRGGKKQHHYPTTHKNLPNVQKHEGNMFNHSFLCKCISVFCKLSLEIQRTKTQTAFVQKVKSHILVTY